MDRKSVGRRLLNAAVPASRLAFECGPTCWACQVLLASPRKEEVGEETRKQNPVLLS